MKSTVRLNGRKATTKMERTSVVPTTTMTTTMRTMVRWTAKNAIHGFTALTTAG